MLFEMEDTNVLWEDIRDITKEPVNTLHGYQLLSNDSQAAIHRPREVS